MWANVALSRNSLLDEGLSMRMMRILLLVVGSTVGMTSELPAQSPHYSGPPRYLILRTPTAPTPHQPTYGYYPGMVQPVQTSGYSYGWFGVQPRRHWSRHFGYYRQYTEWSAR